MTFPNKRKKEKIIIEVEDTVKAIKHNKNGEYAQLRNDLGKIGGDCLDLALSMPFLPKALKNKKPPYYFLIQVV